MRDSTDSILDQYITGHTDHGDLARLFFIVFLYVLVNNLTKAYESKVLVHKYDMSSKM